MSQSNPPNRGDTGEAIGRILDAYDKSPGYLRSMTVAALQELIRGELERVKQECHYKLLPKDFNLIKPLFDAALSSGQTDGTA